MGGQKDSSSGRRTSGFTVMNATVLLILLVGLVSQTFGEVAQTETRICWAGSYGIDTDEITHQRQEECSGSTFVCQRTRGFDPRVEKMECTTASICETNQRSLLVLGTSTWEDEIICCDTDLCNGYVGMLGGKYDDKIFEGSDVVRAPTVNTTDEEDGGDQHSHASDLRTNLVLGLFIALCMTLLGCVNK